MKQLIFIFLFLLLLSSSQKSSAQKAALDFNLVAGTKNVSLGKINGITQDRWGYIWFTDQTNNCLIRYDGYRMETYRNDPTDSNSLASSSFECIAADSSGNIWLPANDGIDKFDPRTGVATHFKFDPNSYCKGGGISAILVDHMGAIWLGTDDGLYTLDQKTGNFTCYSHHDNDPTSLSSDTVRALYEDHEGTLWVGTGIEFVPEGEGGLNRFNKQSGTFTRYVHDPNNPHSLINDKVRAIFEDSRGVFWVGTAGDGLHIMDRKKGTFERLTYDPLHPERLSRPPIEKGKSYDNITFIKEDAAGEIWIGTYNEGLVRYNPVTKEIKRYRADNSSPHAFYDSTSWCAFTSRDGTLWISTERSNVFRVDPLQTGFSATSLNDFAWTFSEDSSHIIWAGLRGNALIRIDRTKPGSENIVRYSVDPAIKNDDLWVGDIFPLAHGMLWIAGVFKGMYFFNSNTGVSAKDYHIDKNAGKDIICGKIIDAGNGKFYLGGAGFYLLDTATRELSKFKHDPSDSSSFDGDILTTMHKDRSGGIWLGGFGNHGLDFFNPNTGKFKHYLSGLTVWSIYDDSLGTVWAGTEKGIFRRDKRAHEFTPFTNEELDFKNPSVNGLIGDDEGNIWGCSSVGIVRINSLKNEMCIYGKKFGTTDLFPAIRMEGLRASNGELFLGRRDGYYSFYSRQVVNHTPPKIILTGLKIDGNAVRPGKGSPLDTAIEDATAITFHYDQNIFSIDFAAIHYADPENNIQQYRLDGYENAWRIVQQEKTAYYVNVPAGHYTFRLRAQSSYGLWSEKTINIIVLAPWWQTWWAYMLYAILLGAAVWFLVKWRTRTLKKEKIILEQKVSVRTKELKEEKERVEETLSELKTTQAQLIQSEKMASLGEMTAGIAHEIQNPLNFVNNFSEVNKELISELVDEVDKGNTNEVKLIAADIKENSEKINHHGKRADAIVKGMLQHSRASTGQKELVDTNALCDEYLRLAYHGLRAKDKNFNAQIKTDFDESLSADEASIGKINVVPQDIGRVILNLINNAFYAVDEKKRQLGDGYDPVVCVSTRLIIPRLGGQRGAEIKISDNGNGIPERIVDKIFQPFFTTKPTGQGTGLGLSLAYDIIKAHGGEIKVESKEGEGSEFIVQLPVA